MVPWTWSTAPNAKRVIVLMEHVEKDGTFKIVNECSLPYTGRRPDRLSGRERPEPGTQMQESSPEGG